MIWSRYPRCWAFPSVEIVLMMSPLRLPVCRALDHRILIRTLAVIQMIFKGPVIMFMQCGDYIKKDIMRIGRLRGQIHNIFSFLNDLGEWLFRAYVGDSLISHNPPRPTSGWLTSYRVTCTQGMSVASDISGLSYFGVQLSAILRPPDNSRSKSSSFKLYVFCDLCDES